MEGKKTMGIVHDTMLIIIEGRINVNTVERHFYARVSFVRIIRVKGWLRVEQNLSRDLF